jgi:NAD(P)-dependent dehydrogenase (short-subunit alcohol dehydrogenase family)
MGALSGKVAVVTGASRGIGKGCALSLGAEGMTVYVTGRTVTPGSYDLPGTVGETAAQVTARGGKGIPVAVDHGNADQIAALFDQVKREQGRCDILVNNAFALPEDMTEPGGFWEKSLDYWNMIDVGVKSMYFSAWHAAKMMVAQKSGVIAAINGYAGVTYTYGVAFGTAKSAIDRMARDMAVELKPHNVVSVSIWQGPTFTERFERNIKKYAGMAQAAATRPENGSTPEYPGLLIAALAKDPDRMKKSGASCINAELAQAYGIKDVNGNTVPSLRELRGAPIWGPIA